MKMYQRLILLLTLTGLMVSCATTTQLRKSWSDPSLTKSTVVPFNKVLVMVTPKKEANKRAAEDQLVSLIKKAKAIQSYTYVTPADTSQKELVERLITDGFDGVITMRVKAVVQTKTKNTNPGTAYESWYSYGNAYGYSYTYTVDLSAKNTSANIDVNSAKDYIVETNIYSLKTKKLLWSGVTASMSATEIDPAIKGIVSTVRKELQKKGFLKD
jgi:hypothetical protein